MPRLRRPFSGALWVWMAASFRLRDRTGNSQPGRPTRGSGCRWLVTIESAARLSGPQSGLEPAYRPSGVVADRCNLPEDRE
jgi:hypothetical protein